LYQLSANAYAWMVPNGAWGETNLGLIDCHGQSVLIDTGWDLHCAREMLTGAQPIVAKSPIERVINTHADGDHCWGNQLFADKEIIATDACVAEFHHHSPHSLRALQYAASLLRHVPLKAVDKFGHYMGGMLAPYDFT